MNFFEVLDKILESTAKIRSKRADFSWNEFAKNFKEINIGDIFYIDKKSTMEKIPQISESFKNLETIIYDALRTANPDKLFIDSYFLIRKHLRDYSGTGRHVEGFSEFFYFCYIK